jgi:hypothetical protein
MAKQTIELPIRLELETEDLDLVESGLRLLLMVEDDRETIDRLKKLIEQLGHYPGAGSNPA